MVNHLSPMRDVNPVGKQPVFYEETVLSGISLQNRPKKHRDWTSIYILNGWPSIDGLRQPFVVIFRAVAAKACKPGLVAMS
jgi:hypothetical protein